LSRTLPNAWLASDRAPARMTAVLSLPAEVSTGQQFAASLEVRNDGGATASEVVPDPLAAGVEVRGLSPAAQDIPGGESRTYQWTLVAAESGTLSVEATASGKDAVSKQPISVSAGAQARVQLHSALRAEADGPAQVQVSVGQTIAFTLAATNTGEATALSVSVPPPQGASPALLLISQPSPQDVAGPLETRTFDFTYLAAQPGEAALSTAGAGIDENDGEPVPVGTVSWPRVLVQSSPLLVLSTAPVPARVSVGQAFAIAVAVENRGEAAAAAVVSSLGQTGPGAANVVAAPTSADIAGGAFATFNWKLVGTTAGPMTLAPGAIGADANSGAAIAASLTAVPVLVQTPPSLSGTAVATPASVSTGPPLQLRFDVTNSGQATASAVLPEVPSAAASA